MTARIGGIWFACGLLAWSPAVAYGESAPAQLHNKSISLSWTESRDVKFVNGEDRHVIVNADIGIYVSGNGRIFSQSSRSSMGGRNRQKAVVTGGSSVAPDGSAVRTSNQRYTRTISFEGRSMHIDVQFESGARRVSVNFDDGFRGCTASVIHGKESGMPGQVLHGLNTRLLVLKSVSASTPSCSVSDGNIFGG